MRTTRQASPIRSSRPMSRPPGSSSCRRRLAVFVGAVVVLAVIGDPLDHRTLYGERSENRERIPHGRVRLERAMGEQPVEADGDSDARGDVGERQRREVDPREQASPEQPSP
jgi:hypothetical protein